MKCEKTIESNCDLFRFELQSIISASLSGLLYCAIAIAMCKAFPRKLMKTKRVSRPNIDAILQTMAKYIVARTTFCQAIYVLRALTFFIICCRPTWQSVVQFVRLNTDILRAATHTDTLVLPAPLSYRKLCFVFHFVAVFHSLTHSQSVSAFCRFIPPHASALFLIAICLHIFSLTFKHELNIDSWTS